MLMHPPARHPSLSIVIPLYNEEENVAPLVKAIFRVLAEDTDFLELVLVDDGSHDRTATLALELASRESRIRLIKHESNRGLGAAMRTGFEAAAGELVLYTDADLPFDFDLIPQLLTLAKPQHIVIGYRANRGEGPRRWLLSKGYNLIFHAAFGLRVRDVNFACKLIPRGALRQMHLASEGSFIDAELLLECRRQGLSIVEFPLTYYPRTRGQSTLSRPKVIAGILAEMAKYSLQFSHFRDRHLPSTLRPPFQRYGVAAASVALALLLALLFQPLTGLNFFALFVPAVMFAAWYGGLKPGLMAAALSGLAIDYFLLSPAYSLTLSWDDLPRLGLLILATLFVAGFTEWRKWAE